jgi:hypothetical protein
VREGERERKREREENSEVVLLDEDDFSRRQVWIKAPNLARRAVSDWRAVWILTTSLY